MRDERLRRLSVGVLVFVCLDVCLGGGGDFNKIVTLIIRTREINFQNHGQNALVLCALPVGLMLNKRANFLKYQT